MMNKKDFPIFKHNPNLIYLDTASTSQKPQCVIDAESYFLEKNYANVHRGVYALSENATKHYENVRQKTTHFINAKNAQEIIFTKGTTESINLVAHSFGLSHLKSGDEIIISTMEHHSNIVPWQQVCEKTGAQLKIISLNSSGEIDFAQFEKLLNTKTKLIALAHASNVLGTINPVKKIIEVAHEKNIPVLLDGAQAVGHLKIDMQDLDCDFYAFSAHKMYGPTGVGVLYAKKKYLETMTSYQTGGSMIAQVTFEKTEFADLPAKFEAGTPNISGVIAFGAAIDYLNAIGTEKILAHENALLNYATDAMQKINGLKIVGTSTHKTGVISFTMDSAHPHDIATILDQNHVAARAGHHCAMPLMHYLNVPALTRVSFGIYNDFNDVDQLLVGLENVRKIFL